MKEKEAFVRHFREVQPKFARLCISNLACSGLTMPQYTLLNILAGGAVPMKDLSARLHITKPTITNLVDRLEKHGFLKRVADRRDRRVSLIKIRPKGTKLVRNMQSTILEFLLRTLDDFSVLERQTITLFYEKLSRNFDRDFARKSGGKR